MPRTELIRVSKAAPPSPWSRMVETVRSYWTGPLTAKSPEIARVMGEYGAGLSGVSVNEFTALTCSAVWSAVSLISDDIASMPLHLYKRSGTSRERFEGHPLYRLLHDEPNSEMDAIVFRRTMQAHVLLWQNAYAEIERDGAGRPIALWPLVPERVSVERVAERLRYRVKNGTTDAVIDPANMIHLVGQSHDGSVGSSLVQHARESIGLALAAEQFGAAFFGNGATFGGVISFKGPKPPEMSEQGYRAQIEARHQGVTRAHKVLALYNEAQFTETGVEPDSAQFLETRVFQIREVARWFKMPPHKLGDLADATYSNVEQMDSAYLSSCLRPWLKLWEQQLTRKLVARLERSQQYIEHDTHGFLSVDAASRAALYTAESAIGSTYINEIRGYENRNPIKGGDEPLVQIQNIPLSMVAEYWRLQLDEKKAQIEQIKAPPPPPPTEDQDRTIRQLRTDLEAAKGQIEEARADEVHARELLDGAQVALDVEKAERKIEQARHVAAISERDVTIAELGGRLESESAASENFRAKWTEEIGKREAVEIDLVKEQAEHDVTQTREAEARQALSAVQAELQVATEKRDEALAARAAEETDHASTKVTLLIAQGQETIANEAARQACEALLQMEAGKQAADQRADQAERDKAIAEQAQQAANEALEQRRRADVAKAGAIVAAHRAMVVDVMRRMVERESDRARRHQTTPQKLRAWADTFYGTHVDVMAEALTPVVAVHLAWMGSQDDPAIVARSMAEAHVEESRQNLRDVLQVEDFAPTFERMVSRWEQRRPETVADRCVAEGVAHVRSL